MLVYLPYTVVTWAGPVSRYSYSLTVVAALVFAAAVAHAVRSGHPQPRVAALAATLLVGVLGVNGADLEIKRYLETSRRTRVFMRKAMRLPPPRPSIHVLDCPMGSQHFESAMELFHHTRSRFFFCATREQAASLGRPRWIWRWLPRYRRFVEYERVK